MSEYIEHQSRICLHVNGMSRKEQKREIVIEMTVATAAAAALRALLIEILSFDVIYDVFI